MDAGGDGRKRHSLPRSRRLTNGSEIRGILHRGKRSKTPHLDVYDSPSPVSRSRVGVVVPRYGHRIVDRNRLKRRLREILRSEILPRLSAPESGRDVLVRVRRNGYEAAFADLRAELLDWWEQTCSRGLS